MSDEADIEYWRSRLVGKTLVEEESSYSGDQFVKRSQLPKLHRVIPPGGIVTLDFRPDRLNLRVTASKAIQSVSFG